jgi:hypothetical protein
MTTTASPETSSSSYQLALGSMSGPKASTAETGRSVSPPMATVNRRPRRSITRWLPCTLTMPPSSTPACCTLVTDSSPGAARSAASCAAAGASIGGAIASTPAEAPTTCELSIASCCSFASRRR